MTTKTTHTPTPWTIENNDENEWLLDGPDTEICTLHCSEANAAHIVKCVNEREELLEALRIAGQRLRNCGQTLHLQGRPETSRYAYEYAEHITSLLTRAEQEG